MYECFSLVFISVVVVYHDIKIQKWQGVGGKITLF